MAGWRQFWAVMAFIIWMETTGRHLADTTPDAPAHRPPILELPPHVTLPWDDHSIEPAILLDVHSAVRLPWQGVTEGAAEPNHLPHRQIIVAQPPVVSTEQLPPPLPPMGWLADDGSGMMPMRRMLPSLIVPPAFTFDDLAGFVPGPLFGQG